MSLTEPRDQLTPADLGRNLRHARKNAGLTLHQLAQRTGFSVRLLSEAERGKPGVSIGRILDIAAAVGVKLTTRDAAERKIAIAAYPQLRLLVWQGARRRISERDALALYEANWRFVDPAKLEPHEAELIDQLKESHAAGVLNV